MQGASVGVELKRFAWLGLALLVVEKKWVPVGSQVTTQPERHTEVHRAFGGRARQIVSGFFFSNP